MNNPRQSSISFDHAADFYDATRALPPDVSARLTDALVREISAAGAARVLEVGIGTGRIARPLAERGVRVCGIDIAPRMLARLREQLTPGHMPPGLLLADAMRLPFAEGAFRAIIICHILHLVAGWRAAIAEMRRALAPGGVILHFVDQHLEEDHWQAAQDLLDRLLKQRGFARSHRLENNEIDLALAAAGGSCRTVAVAEQDEPWTPSHMLQVARNRIQSWTWEIPEPLLSECLDELEPWARQRFGGLDTEMTSRVSYRLQVWSFR